MSLDRHKILSELGSVMNQLKSADCGCMGRLFGDSGQPNSMAASAPPSGYGCRGNCCHGYGWNSNSNQKPLYNSCMGQCNPPKLYADTYNYLTKNLVQPAINEVYNDLKSLSPANTVVNNPLASQMFQNNNMSDMSPQNQMNMENRMDNTNVGNALNNFTPVNMNPVPVKEPNINQMNPMGGMGPQIMNMFEGNNTTNNKPMLKQASPLMTDASQLPHGQAGMNPTSKPMATNQNVNWVNDQTNVWKQNPNSNQTMMQPYESVRTQNSTNWNPAAQQMQAARPYGQHTQGISKFNEMFPGVMSGLGGDLGFDPMAIAIQMNPANQQQAALDTMHKMLHDNKIDKVFNESAKAPVLRTVLGEGAANTATPNLSAQQMQNNVQPNQALEYNVTNQQGLTKPLSYAQPKYVEASKQATNQNVNNFQPNKASMNNNENSLTNNNQQVYNMIPGEPNQQMINYQTGQSPLQQTIINPNTGNVIAPPVLPETYEVVPDQLSHQNQSVNPPIPADQTPQQIIKEPIHPVDTSRYTVPGKQKYYQYNTLGQPVEMLSARPYQTPVPTLPQTLSPQPVQKSRSDPSKYSAVKSTVSKTSLTGKIGRSPSHLQHIYNQYKGSQSFTQQNILPDVKPASYSQGRLNPPIQSNPAPVNIPIEKIGGDTAVNNPAQYQVASKYEQKNHHIGDVPHANKPIGDSVPEKIAPVSDRKCRNGLQDIVYTSYPTSTSWSFHGPPAPVYTAGYRYRKKY